VEAATAARDGATDSAMSRALNDIEIRFATPDDAGLLLRLIQWQEPSD
jgi:hypothetical protein